MPSDGFAQAAQTQHANLLVRRNQFCQFRLQQRNCASVTGPRALPHDVATRIRENNIRVVRIRILYQALPFLIVALDQDIMGLLLDGNLLPHPVKNHFNGKGRCARQVRDLVVKNMGAFQVQRRKSLVPFLDLVAAFAGKTNDEQQWPAASLMREAYGGAIESRRLGGRDLLSETRTRENRGKEQRSPIRAAKTGSCDSGNYACRKGLYKGNSVFQWSGQLREAIRIRDAYAVVLCGCLEPEAEHR